MRRELICGMAAVAVGVAAWMACSGAGPAATAPMSRALHKKTDQIRGFSMQLCDPAAEEVNKDLAAIDELSDMGCTWLNFVISARQDNIHSETIFIPEVNTPQEKDILRIMAKAKSRGMGVMMMPIVLLMNSGSKDWRGVIDPEATAIKGESEDMTQSRAWDNWFAQYTDYITYMAKLAQEADIDVFCVGSELLSTETFRSRWIHCIDEIRKVYKGKLTYSANWDHYDGINHKECPQFWDQVDYIGMNNYNELGAAGTPVDKLDENWIKIKEDILKFAAAEKKPFMFTEVGWHNLRNTIPEPWNYVATDAEIDLDEQANAYQSFVDTWGNVSNDKFMGAFIWQWAPGVDGAKTHGTYSLQNTDALKIVKKWMGAQPG